MVCNMVHVMVHDLRKNTVELQVFLWRTLAPKVYTRRTKYRDQNFKFFEPSAWFVILFHLTYMNFS